MRQFVPSDYVDKKGNVYETVGENIRNGQNGAVTSDFPTPEELAGGLVSSDGKNYIPVMKRLADTSSLADSSYVIRSTRNLLSYESPISTLSDESRASTPPMTTAVVNYIKSKIPNNTSNYSWVTVNVTYDGTSYSIDDDRLHITTNGDIYSDTNGVIELFLISASTNENISANFLKGFTVDGKAFISFDIKASYTAKVLIEG